MGVLKCAEGAALLHEFIDLKHYLLTDLVRQRDKWQAADYVAYLADARAFVYGTGIDSVTADDLHIGEVASQKPDKIAVEFDSEIRFVVGDDLLQEFRDRTGSDAKLENSVIFIGRDPRDHFLRKLRRARFDRTDLAGILQESLQELNVFVHPRLYTAGTLASAAMSDVKSVLLTAIL